ncbi:5-(carboxyamino)imidazole ribonucleotide synthase [Leifsonia sp. 98AMF]|jgi:5-(carboxyamino)imidazole ribonucleotide synthase|uniref:5-(carboxyamino)imidazole ribonucleotide synthase n=1 Tax=unclassified Leifsonia TaxID=2663824 RepID=UPI0003AAAF23|nr:MULTISPECIES: 5-(carboxyamino)imidazole ribonucleotide synthase [unclassified Leifsonia]TDQ02840.1 5-(carboxyamino)imidazole ribonucleotide synthase [Leifsonia sp. 115AMFTsu3.1]SDH18339.1 5-(carboxyamino)imidazole ribonucleotide synthase [Leifsonia sp. 197AMF]SDJ20157.1 5-(carboxyamino)imidazole ribonucleotide synthase [Leifsonia sp. 466MF]SDJ45551.1 5-(carboxyamino)imidazole ribonucleotide synthase [Leifsonia sp. 157MF]SDN41589.1 5-(carboxyamino)imidazole ribonucleotide synthase [Leifsonia
MASHIVGVIGGGQLARMMIPPAIELGVDIRVLEEAEGMSADIAASGVGDYRDLDTVLAFAETVDVITFDHEHVPQAILRELVSRGIPVHPGPDALLYAQDKLQMRAKLSELGLPVPDWAAVESADELGAFLADHGGRAVVKTARGGYDGKGVRVVSDASGADDWFLALAEDGRGGALLVEELVPFRRELAQLVARRPSGEIAAWPVVETVQRDGVCAEVLAPAPGAAGRVAEAAADIARRVADGLGVTGVLAVELFETTDGRVLINELAMRPHNSGHWSIEGAVTSQFEQHLRAVLDLPLGSTEPRADWSVMVNILGGPSEGSLQDRYPAALAAHPEAKFHGYGKEPRPGRKVGHVTVVGGEDIEDVVYRARAAAAFFEG